MLLIMSLSQNEVVEWKRERERESGTFYKLFNVSLDFVIYNESFKKENKVSKDGRQPLSSFPQNLRKTRLDYYLFPFPYTFNT